MARTASATLRSACSGGCEIGCTTAMRKVIESLLSARLNPRPVMRSIRAWAAAPTKSAFADCETYPVQVGNSAGLIGPLRGHLRVTGQLDPGYDKLIRSGARHARPEPGGLRRFVISHSPATGASRCAVRPASNRQNRPCWSAL